MKISAALREALEEIRKELRIKDIGIDTKKRIFYLLSNAKRLNRLVKDRWLWRHLMGDRYYDVYVWDDLDHALTAAIDKRIPNANMHEYQVVPIPEPGHPEGWWFSVKNNRKVRSKKVPKYNICDEDNVDLGHHTGPALLQNIKTKLPPIFASHGVAFHDFKAVRKCGGLLWPSVAITWKIPVGYGDVVFILDSRLIPSYLKPLGKPDKNVLITATDSWSPAGRELETLEKAINWELRGDLKWWSSGRERDEGGYGQRGLQDKLLYGNDDPNDLIGGWAPDAAWTTIKTMPQLWRRVKHLIDVHTEVTDLYGYETRDSLMSRVERDDVYPYLEMKIRGTVDLDNFVACLFPARYKKRVNKFLDDLGFYGWRVPVNWKGPTLISDPPPTDQQRVQWAQTMTQGLLAWAENPCSNKTIPETIAYETDPQFFGRSPFSATALWNPKYDYEFGGHIGWRSGYCYKKRTNENTDL